MVGALGLVNPRVTMFTLTNPGTDAQAWTDVEHVSPQFLLMVMGQEDQALPGRWTAVDPNKFFDRVQAHLEGEEDASGSTIPQQLAKNVFLWRDPSAFRKLLEEPLAEEAALLLTNRRM